MKCTQCGSDHFQPGFIEDNGEGSKGFARWIEGRLERGIFGGAKRMGKPRWTIDAYRCTQCSHLELYVQPPE